MSDTQPGSPGGSPRGPAAAPQKALWLFGGPAKKPGRALHLPKSDVPSVPETLKRPGGKGPT